MLKWLMLYIDIILKWLKSFVHNVIVHPLMMFLPPKIANNMHDKNANWAFSLNRYDELSLELGVRT